MMVFETMFFYVEFESMKRAVRKTTVNQTLIKQRIDIPININQEKNKKQKTKNKLEQNKHEHERV
jgi:hypothetical protein